ncbi:hypothetical protein [uncultured Desulfovibrio sp.]|uniref:hypothetical protein n=1 Tax=uncultured Desulfovibrio sp. TaxID=167968 RepID=UPI00263B97DC|nr:hypothetical protein [uncultured Desulfovibrio sp.]
MMRTEFLGQREELRLRRKGVEAELKSHTDSLRSCLPIVGDLAELEGEYIMSLAIKINALVQELRGIKDEIAILERNLGL